MNPPWIVGLSALLLASIVACGAALGGGSEWTADEVEAIRSLWIGELEPLTPDPSNRFADDTAAAALGHKIFFDTRFSANGEVSCATCHLPGNQFQDGIPLGRGVGLTDRRTMPIAGTAYHSFLFWDGRKDSQWSQALGPLESDVEHGGTRALYAHLVAEYYEADYERVFGEFPELDGIPRNAGPVADSSAREAWEGLTAARQETVNHIFANVGKAIAAYERLLKPGRSRFDEYVESLAADGSGSESILTPDERAGLRLFIGKANCTQCHNGPLLTDDHFHNTGVPAAPGLPSDPGRARGALQVMSDEFNCRSRYSDAGGRCPELDFLKPDDHELVRAFKTPSLRGVAERAPYMHAGQISTLSDVIEHYNRAAPAPDGHTEIRPLRLSAKEKSQLEAYLRTLESPIDADARWLRPPD
jgi:cytochrome c peroxidase